MNTAPDVPRLSLSAIRRADVIAYNFALFGVWLVFDNGVTALENGVVGPAVGGMVLGGFSLLAGSLAYRNANDSEKMENPAPTHLLVLAGIETVLVAYLLFDIVGRIA